MKRITRLFFVAALFFVNPVLASDFYWMLFSNSGSSLYSEQFQTPSSACSFLAEQDTSSKQYEFVGLVLKAEGDFYCQMIVTTNGVSAPPANYGRAIRRGDSCPVGSEYNSATGECVAPEPDQCAPTNGQLIGHMHKQADITEFGGMANLKYPPDSLCDGSCEYTTPAVEGCYRFASGDPAGVFCDYSYRGTGVSCTADTTKPEHQDPESKTPVAEKTNECTNKVEDAEGRQSFSCTAADKYTDPGNMDCGEVNGEFQCLPKTPTPKQTEKIVVTDVSEKVNADGSKDTTTTTTTTTTTCTGANACQSTTTTNVNNSKTNADGTDGGSSDTCTGPGCKDADGKDQEDREEEGNSVTGESCDVAVTCNGDAVQCAILRQQKEQRCAVDDAMDYDKHKAQIDQLTQGEEYQVKEETFEIPSFATGATRFLPSSACPAPGRVTLTSGRSLEFDYSPFCGFAEGLAPVVVAGALLFAALYVGRGLGGS